MVLQREIILFQFIPIIFLMSVLAPWSVSALEPRAGNPERGKPIYVDRCASCHGPTGNGDGPRAPFLSPRPGNLISAATSVKSDKELLNIIADGKPRTAMPPWKDLLTQQEQVDVLAYIRSLIHFNPESLTPLPPNHAP